MTSRRISVALAAGLAIAACMGGCEKKKPPPLPPPPPVNNDPPPPEPVDLKVVAQSMGASGKIQFGQSISATDEDLARAVINFCDALARGDSARMYDLVDELGQDTLDILVDEGTWEEATAKVEAVRIVRYVESGSSATVRLAIQEPGVAYPLAWHFEPGGTGYLARPLPMGAVTRTRATDFDAYEEPTTAPAPTEEGNAPGAPPGPGTPPGAPGTPPGRDNSPGSG